ncbi:hypothetical protein TthAK1_23000 (plasmid) [Thermus thermophilus]|uniref:DUF1634 domain-containing protein n=1 Tax=Thermus thermophilus TaxID=274 RepID=UPI001C7618A1|nr:DUF1634 domain-containing protein [Thermus thermophilus]BCZ95683.1 hypothetical protein TthAK1_23000 [Thermus thermophilus]
MAALLSLVLRGGVLLAALLVLIGGVGELLAYGDRPAAALLRRPLDLEAWTPAKLLPRALAGQPEAWIALGLWVLILTPVARVALSALLFARERDWLYTGVVLWVLALLILGLLGRI